MLGFSFATFEKISYNLQLAFRSLWLHKLRAFLSVMGIIIGTGAVISLMSFGEGSMRSALDDIKRLGATNIIIRSVKPIEEGSSGDSSFFVQYGLTEADYERLQNISTVTRHVPLRVFLQEMWHRSMVQKGRVVGTTARYADVHQFSMAQGRFLTESDSEEERNHAVLGKNLAQKLFPAENPLGQTVTIGKYMYVVVGVVADRMPTGGAGGSLAGEEYNNDMYIPLVTCNSRFGERIFMRTSGSRSGEQVQLHQVTLTVDSMENVKQTAEVVRNLMSMYHTEVKDWEITVPLDRLEAAERTKATFQRLLFMIASISLIVGGIGIMNIMLATVTERTREIGIRRALGAKRSDITMQFLIEATAQTGIGGILGVVVGIGVVTLIPPILEAVFNTVQPAILHVPSIFYGLAVAVGVGIIAGLYPAIQAARMDPVEALRHM